MTEPGRNPIRANDVRRERWAILGAVLLLLAAAAAPQAFRRRGGKTNLPPPLPNDGPPLKPSPAVDFRGIALQLHSSDPDIPFDEYVEEIAGTGANTICLSVAAFQENCSASSVFIEYRKVPSVKRLEKLIRLSRRRGLRVVLMPIILLENPRGGEWRGKIDPPKLKDWWEDYENIILHYAKIAEKAGAEAMLIGSELVLLEKHTDRWRGLIRKVRKVYKGRLSYSANWDHYENIPWWGDLDMIGMTVYYDLVGDNKPSLDVLLSAWKPIKKKILAWRRKKGLPILFSEVGWPSQTGCAKEPWNYYGSTTPDPKTQDLCFQAFFQTWGSEKDVAGVLLWEWRNHPAQVGGMKDTSYVFIGKPAMQTIRRFFKSKSTATKPQTPTASAPTTSAAPGSGR